MAILTALNDHLRDELEDNGTKHDQALSDILGRLQAAQQELEHLRSNQRALESGLKVCYLVRGLHVFVNPPWPKPPTPPELEREGTRVPCYHLCRRTTHTSVDVLGPVSRHPILDLLGNVSPHGPLSLRLLLVRDLCSRRRFVNAHVLGLVGKSTPTTTTDLLGIW